MQDIAWSLYLVRPSICDHFTTAAFETKYVFTLFSRLSMTMPCPIRIDSLIARCGGRASPFELASISKFFVNQQEIDINPLFFFD